MSIRILALSGSARRDSHNRKLLAVMAQGAVAAGATVETWDFHARPLPLMDEDLEAEGVPENARALKAAFRAADGFLIATPEYNGGYPPLLKNAIDWASRAMPGDAPGSVYKNKTCVLAGATIGRWGAVRSQRQLREVLGYLGCIMLPETLSVSEAGKAFDGEGGFLDAKTAQLAQAAGRALVLATAALKRPAP